MAVGVSRHRFLNTNISYKNADKLLKLGRHLEWNAVCLSIPNIVFQKFILFRYLGPNWPKSRNLANFTQKSGQKFVIFQKLSNSHFCIYFFYNLAKFHVSSSFLSKVNSKSVIQRYKILTVGVSRHRFLNSNISYKMPINS